MTKRRKNFWKGNEGYGLKMGKLAFFHKIVDKAEKILYNFAVWLREELVD